MSIRANTSTRYKFGPTFCRFIPNNPDGSINSPSRIVSDGAGPFDFSDVVSDAAVTITLKLDNGVVLSDTLDLSGAGDIAAVTVAELVTAFTAASISGYTASAEAGTGYLKIVKTSPGSARYLQIGGEVAEFAGFTTTIIPVDTQKSIAVANTNHDSERIETIDSNGKVTAIVTDSYPTGAQLTVVDSAYDQNLRATIEGGTFVDGGLTARKYQSPGPSAKKPIVTVETFNGLYAKDDSLETALLGYTWRRFQSCKGTFGDETGDRNFQDGTFTLAATPYLDPVTNVKDDFVYTEQILTVAEYQALHVFDV